MVSFIVTAIAVAVLYPSYLAHSASQSLSNRKPEDALEFIARLEQLKGPSGDSSFLAARAYRRLGRLNEAHVRLQQAERLGVSTARVHRELRLGLAQSGQMSLAEPHLGELLLAPGENASEVCEAFVTGYVIQQRYEDARRLLDGWIADIPDDEQAWFFYGRILATADQTTEAITKFERALEINPTRDDVRVAYAKALTDLHKYEAAEIEYRSLLLTSPDSKDVLNGWATWLSESGRNSEAIQVCRQLLHLQPDDFPTELKLAQLLYREGEYEASERLLKKLHAIAPRNADVCFTLGGVLRSTGDSERARPLLEYAQEAESALARVTTQVAKIQTRPDDVELRLEIAQTLLNYGREDEGLRWLLSVLEYNPEHIQALTAIVAYFEENDQPDRAAPFLTRLRYAQSSTSETES